MQGHSKTLQSAAAAFAEKLSEQSGLVDSVELVVNEIQAEIDQAEAEIAKHSAGSAPGSEMAVAFRKGALRALTADRTRWTSILDSVKGTEPRPMAADGFAYIRKTDE